MGAKVPGRQLRGRKIKAVAEMVMAVSDFSKSVNSVTRT